MGGLVLVNILVWILAGLAAKEYPSLLGAMVIAYTLGLRHAVDADHLAAIDNVTRKLIYQDSLKARAEGLDSWTPPVCVGLFFSLGHSTIVIVASVALALTATAIKGKLEAFGETGGIIGTSVSAAFLFLIGFINLFVLFQVTENKHADDTDNKHSDETVEPKASRFQAGGLFARIFRPLFNLIDRSWKMYPLGVLFGLGFDTATEVGLLGIAATNAQAGFPTAVILIFPVLFTAGMSLIDTLDGIIMVKAYGWAFVNPVKKLWYNFVVTLLGVIVAFAVGIAELLALLAEKLNLEGPFWDFFTMLSDNFGLIGYVVLATFILTWVFAVLFYKYGPMKDLERRVVESGAV
ncbi:high-affinity nickel-transporter [Linnemannia elongata AG-77]|uniref:Nickel/cobalt efflux system n=1 Tax=Linnemannia elongata AG-77 TaxID=1314771 RepID=A0A197JTA4_9FUNG|nr:high-affinity nickel-transporter [Linnemannia elongata AG-77]